MDEAMNELATVLEERLKTRKALETAQHNKTLDQVRSAEEERGREEETDTELRKGADPSAGDLFLTEYPRHLGVLRYSYSRSILPPRRKRLIGQLSIVSKAEGHWMGVYSVQTGNRILDKDYWHRFIPDCLDLGPDPHLLICKTWDIDPLPGILLPNVPNHVQVSTFLGHEDGLKNMLERFCPWESASGIILMVPMDTPWNPVYPIEPSEMPED